MTTARKYFKPTVTATKGNSGPIYFRGWNDYKVGDYVIGEYLSSYETTYRGKTSPNFRIKVLECNFKVTNKEGKVVDPTNDAIVLNGNGRLNKFMEKVTPGMLVEIVYGGKQPGQDGTLYHTFTSLQAGTTTTETESGDLNDL